MSGFVVELEGRWFWITAGHCLETARRIATEFSDPRFAFQPLAGKGKQVDFSFSSATGAALEQFFSNSEEPDEIEAHEFLKTYDVGFLHLKDLYVRHLRALGVVPLTWEQVRGEEQDVRTALDIEGPRSIYLLGIPSETVELDVVPNGYGSSFLRLPVSITEVSHPKVILKPEWTSEQYGKDVHGISGGPVVLELADGSTFVIAVQSTRFGVSGKMPQSLTAMDAAILFHWLKDYGALVTGEGE